MMLDVQELRERWREIIPFLTAKASQSVNGEPSWVCPLCGHGEHGDGLAANVRSSRAGALKCFGCGFSGDIVDLWQQSQGVGFHEAVEAISSRLGMPVENSAGVDPVRASEHKEQKPAQGKERQERDFSGFFREIIPFLAEKFPAGYRGISLETWAAFGCGYAEHWKHPDAGKGVPTSPRMIIPTSAGSYIAVDVRENLPDAARPYRKQKAGAVHWLNVSALGQGKPCFVVEGEIDCLSVCDVGGAAVGIGSINQRQKFVEAVAERKPSCPLILAFDNDEKGQECQKLMGESLRAAGIPFLSADVSDLYGGAKDANDALQADRERFGAAVERLTQEADGLQEPAEMTAEEYRDRFSQSAFLPELLVAFEKSRPFSSTGFVSLDNLLGGGLYAGLYVVGAISSLGKTTFCVQIADAVAAAGHDVLFFSLEMSRGEIAAKSLSRLTAGSDAPCSTRDILTGAGRKAGQVDAIMEAVGQYNDFSDRLFVVEGVGDVTPEKIRARVQEHITRTGERPLVVVDYLQIVAGDIRASDKQNTDKAVLELKRLSRDYSLPVLAISSFNRDNYSSPVNMAAFKESGAVEYSADVLMGLQYHGMDYKDGEGDGDKARKKRLRALFKGNREKGRNGEPVDVQCKVLKNRNGIQGDTFFEFTARHNLYVNLAYEPEMEDCPIDFGDFSETAETGSTKGKTKDGFGGKAVSAKKESEIVELFGKE